MAVAMFAKRFHPALIHRHYSVHRAGRVLGARDPQHVELPDQVAEDGSRRRGAWPPYPQPPAPGRKQ